MRTHFSDDLLWLPFVVSFYIGVTGDRSILDEVTPFLEARELMPGEDDSYLQPRISAETATVLEHCARTIDRSLKVGRHGLPLMGSGDWNDGMNRVGYQGQGESVWVAWFLLAVLKDLIPFCDRPEFKERVASYEAHLKELKSAVEANAWDGDWYRRAYFDDGTPLGSAGNKECRIDSIAQSWAVLSGAGDSQRSARAMAAVDVHLIHRGDGLVKLFMPPFDKGLTDPGYIKGYVPGVRENGGQYTHAAIWVIQALAQLDEPQRRLAPGDDGVHAGAVAVVRAHAAVAIAVQGGGVTASPAVPFTGDQIDECGVFLRCELPASLQLLMLKCH